MREEKDCQKRRRRESNRGPPPWQSAAFTTWLSMPLCARSHSSISFHRTRQRDRVTSSSHRSPLLAQCQAFERYPTTQIGSQLHFATTYRSVSVKQLIPAALRNGFSLPFLSHSCSHRGFSSSFSRVSRCFVAVFCVFSSQNDACA